MGSANVPARRILPGQEIFWRAYSMNTWHLAIAHGHPGIRDYPEYLVPWLKREAFLDMASSQDFWLREAQADELPLNRIIGLTGYAQLAEEIIRGNNDDQQHAARLGVPRQSLIKVLIAQHLDTASA